MFGQSFRGSKIFSNLISVLFVVSSCAPEQFFSPLPAAKADLSPELVRSGPAACTPFEEGPSGPVTSENGLSAEIRIPPLSVLESGSSPGSSGWTNLDKFNSEGVKLEYLNSLNVPTRAFSTGFPKTDGGNLLDSAGNTLFEWFQLKMKADFQLSASDVSGDYEFALLSDDGSRLSLGGNRLINYPSNTPTRLHCSNSSIFLNRTTRLPLEVEYFQGPRHHIALMLLWRKASATQEPLCGSSGNAFFFDSTQDPSAPTANYEGLLDRGWKVISPDHFFLQDGEQNPCY
jgi:hypothetical protein